MIINTTRVFGNHNQDDAHERKVVYYNQLTIREWCVEVSAVQADNVCVTACVLTWRGVSSMRPMRELKTLCVMKANCGLMSVKSVKKGRVECYVHFVRTAGF